MGKILIPSKSAECWKHLLADKKHWKPKYSARTLAYSWQEANGFPDTINNVFQKSDYPIFNNVELLLAIPEYKVFLNNDKAPSQNDVFALAKGDNGLISITVEGKVDEPFDKYVHDWDNDSKSRQERLSFLCDVLGVNSSKVQNIRYQLLHRTVSAILEAKKFNAPNALMIIHAFEGEKHTDAPFKDYANFAQLFRIKAKINHIHHAKTFKKGITLYLGWVVGDKKYLTIKQNMK